MKWKEELRHNITEACEVRDLLKLGAAEEVDVQDTGTFSDDDSRILLFIDWQEAS